MTIPSRGLVVSIVCVVMASIGPGRARAEGPAFKTVHLFNLASGAEADLLAALDEVNQAIAKEGYPDCRYRVWKVQGDQQGSHAYLWESTWPDRAVYAKVHDAQSYQRAIQRVRSAIEAPLKDHVYNQYEQIAVAGAKK